MDTFFAYTVLILGMTFFLLGVLVTKTYYTQKNKISLYIITFFFVAAAGWIQVFLFSSVVLNIYEANVEYLLIWGFLAPFILFLFIARVFQVRQGIVALVSVSLIPLYLIHIFAPELHLLTILATVFILLTTYGFVVNYRRRGDGKSIGFALGLIGILVGEAVQRSFPLLGGIAILFTAFIVTLGFTGKLSKKEFLGKS